MYSLIKLNSFSFSIVVGSRVIGEVSKISGNEWTAKAVNNSDLVVMRAMNNNRKKAVDNLIKQLVFSFLDK